jgi:hypothetical protein
MAAAAASASPPQPRPGHMLVLGTGFVGRYVSQRLLAQGWSATYFPCSSILDRILLLLPPYVSPNDQSRFCGWIH